MDEKPGYSAAHSNEEADREYFLNLLKQESLNPNIPIDADENTPFDRAAGDVTFTLEQTCKYFRKGNNDYVSEILRTAFQHKKRGKSLLQDNTEFFEELQKLDERMYYAVAAMNQGLKAQVEFEVEVDQALWYYERIEDPTFVSLRKIIDARNHKIMGLLTTKELETDEILEIQSEVELIPDVKGKINPEYLEDVKWLADLQIEAQAQPEDDELPPEPITPIDEAPASVTNVISVFRASTVEYFTRVLEAAEKYIAGGKIAKTSDKSFDKVFKGIKPNRKKAITDSKLAISEAELEMAIMFYTQTQHKEFKAAMAQINSVTQKILAKLQGEGLTKADVSQFKESLKFTSA